MKVFNTLGRKIEELVPLDRTHVRMYTCGPTVYDFAHIGNFRAYVFEDLLRRRLKHAGYRVTQVMNLTDVDDKTIRGARAAKIPLSEFTGRFKTAFFEDLKTLNIDPAERYPAATDHVPEMIALIRRLIEKGVAYRSNDGSVYFSIAKFPAYGRLSQDVVGRKAGARVAQDEYEKENVADFALWKAWDEGDGDVGWDSPWGRGRPGWHIECSAMSMKYLGESFDIHTGGVDNMFPHHENEIAQSEAATGKSFVRYWMHCAHLVVDGRKMAKSLGNFYTLRDARNRGYTGREVRYVLLSAHYRQALNFTLSALDGARASLGRLDEFRAQLREVAGGAGGGSLPDWAAKARDAFKASTENDLGISDALAAVFDMAREGHRVMNGGGLKPGEAAGVLELLDDLDRVLGVLAKPDEKPGSDVEALVRAREAARRVKNWQEADRIRNRLKSLGWEVKDAADGPKLKKR
ncbi:MAG: cysteine--tRNA ligase [Verrucomicrobiota bacterium]|nr:cysteine--tRNA ligase [Verrucomicrobiota bacterium]